MCAWYFLLWQTARRPGTSVYNERGEPEERHTTPYTAWRRRENLAHRVREGGELSSLQKLLGFRDGKKTPCGPPAWCGGESGRFFLRSLGLALREVFVGALGGTLESDGAMKASKLTMPLALLLGVSAQNFGGGGMGMDDGGADVDGSGMDGGGIIPSVRAPPCFWTSPGG